MLTFLENNKLLRYAGLFTWASVILPLILLTKQTQEEYAQLGLSAEHVFDWKAWLSWLVFGMSYVWLTRAIPAKLNNAVDYIVLAFLLAASVSLSFYTNTGLGGILLVIVASVLPWILPLRIATVVFIIANIALLPIFKLAMGFTWLEAVMQVLLYVGFSGFVFVTSMIAVQQAEAREEQRQLYLELKTTRALLAESVRVNERTRISRDLHDLLGHHLTALSLNLEVAKHLSEGMVREHVDQAHTLGKLLLSDVREAVSQIRANDQLNLTDIILPLGQSAPGLKIEMKLPQPFVTNDPERSHILIRCTQEIITNTLKHAQANNLSLTYWWEGDVIHLQAKDDGTGADKLQAGNGLKGMEERLHAYGGGMQIETSPGAGFALHLQLPLRSAQNTAADWHIEEKVLQ